VLTWALCAPSGSRPGHGGVCGELDVPRCLWGFLGGGTGQVGDGTILLRAQGRHKERLSRQRVRSQRKASFLSMFHVCFVASIVSVLASPDGAVCVTGWLSAMAVDKVVSPPSSARGVEALKPECQVIQSRGFISQGTLPKGQHTCKAGTVPSLSGTEWLCPPEDVF
jgi:hypothetical protein